MNLVELIAAAMTLVVLAYLLIALFKPEMFE